MVSFFFGWRHVVGLWLHCMTWRWVISLNSIFIFYPPLLYIYEYIYILCCMVDIGSVWSAVNWCLFWLPVHNANDVLTGWFIITGNGLWPFVLLYCVPLWCFSFSCGVHVYGCTVSLLLRIHINVFFQQLWLLVFFLFFSCLFFSLHSVQKSIFLPSDWQLFSREMSKMTLCLCSQLNLCCSHREHGQMLTLHFSLDSICTGSTSARLFCCLTWE